MSLSIQFTSHQRNRPPAAHFYFPIKVVSEPQGVMGTSLICGAHVQAGQEALVQYRTLYSVECVGRDALTETFMILTSTWCKGQSLQKHNDHSHSYTHSYLEAARCNPFAHPVLFSLSGDQTSNLPVTSLSNSSCKRQQNSSLGFEGAALMKWAMLSFVWFYLSNYHWGGYLTPTNAKNRETGLCTPCSCWLKRRFSRR